MKFGREIPWQEEHLNPDILFGQVSDSEELREELFWDTHEEEKEDAEEVPEPEFYVDAVERYEEVEDLGRFWSYN